MSDTVTPDHTFGKSAIRSRFNEAGFVSVLNVLSRSQIEETVRELEHDLSDAKGTRVLLEKAWCRDVVHKIRSNPDLALILGEDSVAIQCTYFEKSESSNWLVAFHQDLSVPVSIRRDHPELTGWSEKNGIQFVQAPECLLRELIAVRVHLDDCGIEDGPLRMVEGSHLLGRVPQGEIASRALASQNSHITCTLEKGAALVMRPLTFHGSSKSIGNGRRRVLHFTFGPKVPPYGLEWNKAE